MQQSSRGPVQSKYFFDLKPLVLENSENVKCLSLENGYIYQKGTSMAVPQFIVQFVYIYQQIYSDVLFRSMNINSIIVSMILKSAKKLQQSSNINDQGLGIVENTMIDRTVEQFMNQTDKELVWIINSDIDFDEVDMEPYSLVDFYHSM